MEPFYLVIFTVMLRSSNANRRSNGRYRSGFHKPVGFLWKQSVRMGNAAKSIIRIVDAVLVFLRGWSRLRRCMAARTSLSVCSDLVPFVTLRPGSLLPAGAGRPRVFSVETLSFFCGDVWVLAKAKRFGTRAGVGQARQ
jgi:hypothetical protein